MITSDDTAVILIIRPSPEPSPQRITGAAEIVPGSEERIRVVCLGFQQQAWPGWRNDNRTVGPLVT